jgi:dimethylhistidine N-methyltransferase
VTATRHAVPSVGRGNERARFALDARYYLTQDPRQLPSRYLYDDLGSALFDAICLLPWYPLTRAEARLIQTHATAIFSLTDPVSAIVELGPGNGAKLVHLLTAGRRRGLRRGALDVHLIDVSSRALAAARRRLGNLPGIRLVTHQTTYEAGLAELEDHRPRRGRSVVLFLGSNLGNFDPPGCEAFLRTIRAALSEGDALVLGVDLVKPEQRLVLAYDDPLGLTAAFNRNLLVRINTELGGNFRVDAFAHRAFWNDRQHRIEMHLVSRGVQMVEIPAAQLSFRMADGDMIWTESSYKYDPEEIVSLLGACQFQIAAQWIDETDGFALTVGRAV